MPNTNDQNEPPLPMQQAIAQRAYELSLQRGSVPGYELDDWLQAEAELTAEAAKLAESDAGDANEPSAGRTGARRGAARDRSSTRRTLRP